MTVPGRRAGVRRACATRRRRYAGLGAGALAIEALVLLLAIQPIRLLGGSLGGWAVAAVVALAVAAGVLAGMMRRPWAWNAGTVLQALVLLAGLLHWSLLVLGVLFAGVWVYVAARPPGDPRPPLGSSTRLRHWVSAMPWPSGSRNAAAHSSSFAPRLTARGA